MGAIWVCLAHPLAVACSRVVVSHRADSLVHVQNLPAATVLKSVQSSDGSRNTRTCTSLSASPASSTCSPTSPFYTSSRLPRSAVPGGLAGGTAARYALTSGPTFSRQREWAETLDASRQFCASSLPSVAARRATIPLPSSIVSPASAPLGLRAYACIQPLLLTNLCWLPDASV